MSSFKIFIVEDDPWYGQLLKHHLSLNPDYEIQLFNNAKGFLSNLKEKPQVVCIDFGLPDMQGDKLLSKIALQYPELPVIVISGQEDIEVAVNLLKTGAKDYIVKNDYARDFLWKSILSLRENINLKKEVIDLKEKLTEKYSFEKSFIGSSNAIKNTFKLINKAINNNINVSISGETGTGKEVVAKAIHFNGTRKNKPFVAVNMAAIPKELIESELFGHEKGAFTGAISTKYGKFESANGGTLFLDEIGELDINIQAKLLRAIQERVVVRVGGNKEIPFDVRLITATHKDLKQEVLEGNFREDFYFRIFGLPIKLPPLRERGQDILLLANYFIEEYCKLNSIEAIELSASAKEKLFNYYFPGNVRELKAAVDLACVMCEDNKIEAEDFSFHSLRSEHNPMISEGKTLKEYTNAILSMYLKKYDNNVVKVAKLLDIGKSSIYNSIKKGDVKV